MKSGKRKKQKKKKEKRRKNNTMEETREKEEEILEAEYVRPGTDMQRVAMAHDLAQAYSRIAYMEALSQYGRKKEEWMQKAEEEAYDRIGSILIQQTGKDVAMMLASARRKMRAAAEDILAAAYGCPPGPDAEHIVEMWDKHPDEMNEMVDCLIVEAYSGLPVMPFALLLRIPARIRELNETLLLHDSERRFLVDEATLLMDEEQQTRTAILAAKRLSEKLCNDE